MARRRFALGYAELFSKKTDFPDSEELLDVTFSVKNTILRREGMRVAVSVRDERRCSRA